MGNQHLHFYETINTYEYKKDTVPSIFPVFSFKMRVLQGSHLIIFLCVYHLFHAVSAFRFERRDGL